MNHAQDTVPDRRGRIALTGATGFVGSHLLARLKAQGRSVRALLRPAPGCGPDSGDGVEWVAGSLGDIAALDTLVDAAQTCIHLAGATRASDASRFHDANIIGTFNLAAAARKAGVKHFIHISSQAARAPRLSGYAASKAGGEAALGPFRADMQITVIRPPAVIGPGDPMLAPVFSLLRHGWLPAPAEPRGAPRKFAIISVEDLAGEIDRVASGGAVEGGLIEPCSVPACSWADIAATAAEIRDAPVRLLRMPAAAMQLAGGICDGLGAVFRRPMPISGGKIRELLAHDWTFDTVPENAQDLKSAIASCLDEPNARED